MSWLTTELAHLRNVFAKDLNALAPIEAELAPIAKAALKTILGVGLNAVVAGIPGLVADGITLTAAEALAVTAGRAMAASASSQGASLTEQAALALGASLSARVPGAPLNN